MAHEEGETIDVMGRGMRVLASGGDKQSSGLGARFRKAATQSVLIAGLVAGVVMTPADDVYAVQGAGQVLASEASGEQVAFSSSTDRDLDRFAAAITENMKVSSVSDKIRTIADELDEEEVKELLPDSFEKNNERWSIYFNVVAKDQEIKEQMRKKVLYKHGFSHDRYENIRAEVFSSARNEALMEKASNSFAYSNDDWVAEEYKKRLEETFGDLVSAVDLDRLKEGSQPTPSI